MRGGSRLSVWWLFGAALALAGCGSRVDGGARAVVAFTRFDTSPACIRVIASDVATLEAATPLRASTDVSISDLELTGEIAIGIGRGTDWSNELEVTASLHLGTCTAPANVSATQRVTLRENELPNVELVLNQVGRADSGTLDGGPSDAGMFDGGRDAGPLIDAGPLDASVDAGTTDAGIADAGTDAGARDAGFDSGVPDAGFDAGLPTDPTCTGSAFKLGSPLNLPFNDIAMFTTNIALLVGNGANIFAMASDGGFESWSSPSCSGVDFKALWVRNTAQIFVASNGGRLLRFGGPADCSDSFAPIHAGSPSAIGTYGLGNNTRMWVTTNDPATINRIELNMGGNPVGDTVEFTHDAGLVSGPGELRDIAGTSDSNAYAVGVTGGNGFILKYDTDTNLWQPLTLGITLGEVNAIAFASPTSGFAGGTKFVVFNGATWLETVGPGFVISALKVYSPTNVIAVGSFNSNGTYGLARWNGAAWLSMPTPNADSAVLSRVDGTSTCDTWAVGSKMTVLTTNDRP